MDVEKINDRIAVIDNLNRVIAEMKRNPLPNSGHPGFGKVFAKRMKFNAVKARLLAQYDGLWPPRRGYVLKSEK